MINAVKKVVRRFRWVLLVLICAGMASAVARTAFAGPSAEPRAEDRVAALRELAVAGPANDLRLERPEGDWVGGLALIEPAMPESRLAPALPGRIAAIRVREGQTVRAGEVLVELESTAERAALAAAEADVEVAEVQVSRTRAGVRDEDLEALGSESEAARTRSELSQGILSRLESAAQTGGAVTTDELDRARRQAEADRLTAQTAEARRRAGLRGRPIDVRLAQAQLDAAIARREQARAQLERLQIVAPIDGEILEVHFRVGEYVQPGGAEPVIVMGDTRQLRARVDVDERDLARVAPGARALLVVDALPGERFAGEVIELGRRMGRKNVRTDEPTERIDTKILEVVVALESSDRLVVGQRAMAYLAPQPVTRAAPAQARRAE